MLNAIPLDPNLPRQRRTVRSGVIYSGLSIALILFAVGELPQVNQFLLLIDAMLRAHNDAVVTTVLRVLPFALVAAASFGLVYRALGYLNKHNRSV